METLLDILPRIRELGAREAVRFSDGLRTRVWSYHHLYAGISAFAGFLEDRGIGQGDRLTLWCENRPEWLVVFWAGVGRGVQMVPLDRQTHSKRVARIHKDVGSRLLVTDSDARIDSRVDVDRFAVGDIARLPEADVEWVTPVGPDDIAEIVYTSGTTAEPKGVVHRHRNITANLTPVAREIRRYRHWARPFQPIRILDMLPFSHMFGQAIGVFVPPLLGGSVVLTRERHPGAVARRIRRERVSVLAGVPRLLSSLQGEIERAYSHLDPRRGLRVSPLRRWWRYRRIHSDLGWKFWAFVVGGAELPRRSEEFWSGLGFAVVQGYGLTETSPVVAVNHPFHSRRGTLGKAIGDQEIRIAGDGEILVRGASIVSEYLGPDGRTEAVTDNGGWLHTGDIGAMDRDGRLVFRGRKKDVIVLPDGFNVYPEDVEQVLNETPGVLDSAVVAVRADEGGDERVHAALILADDSIPVARILEAANSRLEPQQRIHSSSVWKDAEFPRTPSTMKIRRHEVARRIQESLTLEGSPASGSHTPGHTLGDLVAEATGGVAPRDMSSLERVDLQALLEERLAVDLDEAEFSGIATIDQLEDYVTRHRRGGASPEAPARRVPRPGFARWPRWRSVQALRRAFQFVVIRPLLRVWVRVDVDGLGNLPAEPTPLIFAATHQSHLDVPVVFSGLPSGWRERLAPAMMQEHFYTASGWVSWIRAIEYYLTSAVFNGYPLPQHAGQIRASLEHTGALVSEGACPLVFPEGRRSEDGRLQTFRSGIGFMSLQLRVPVVPLRIHGLQDILPVGARWPRRGVARLRIGPVVHPTGGESYRAFAKRVEDLVRSMS